MRDLKTSRRGGLAVLGLLACVLCAVLPAGANAAGAKYVAMGDSYTAGPGITPYAEGAPADCGQSSLNYPHLVASALNLSLTDVSCGGAKTENFTVAQFPDQPPQFDALGESTEIVTVGMGGNDGNLFGTLVQGCSETDFTTPGKAPCKAKFGAFAKAQLEADKAPAEQALQEIKVLAPNAKVFVVGYPDIAPKVGKCFNSLPWTEGDLKWFVVRSRSAATRASRRAPRQTVRSTSKRSSRVKAMTCASPSALAGSNR